ncbi:MAG: hypothetical protein HFH91_00625 [Lachnospiraceae bacterium]|nr:hypothetical protein [Lachnospiraceae bacterium]
MNLQKFSEAMNQIDSRYLQEAMDYQRKNRNHRLAKWGALAACLAILLVTGSLFFPFQKDIPISVHARDTEEEITAAGAIISTGSISDTGEMRGKPLMFYLSGRDIAAVRFSCKNQMICFVDWTEQREEYGNARNFTVAYGENEQEYYYLTIDWVPDSLIRELTHGESSCIAALPEEMRRDLIVLEITFADGKTATKALEISLLDDGTFFAAFDDYQITEADAFVRRPDSEAIPRDVLYAQGAIASSGAADAPPMVRVTGVLYRQSINQKYPYTELPEGCVYLGKIESDVSDPQSGITDGVPREDFQANIPITGAAVYQYNNDLVVYAEEGYLLYEALPEENAPEGNDESSEEEKKQLDPSYNSPAESAVPENPRAEADTQLPSTAPAADKNALSAAEEAARAYYNGTVFEVVSMEILQQSETEIVFSVTASKGGVIQEPDRSITLQPEDGTWKVVSEGY